MPTLEDQLLQNKKDEIQHQLANPKFGKVKSAISNASVIAGFLAFFIVVGLIALFFVINTSWAAALFIVWFYGGIALAVYLQEVLEKLLVKFVHYHYELSKEEYDTTESVRNDIWKKRWDIEKDIQYRDAAIKREIKAEEYRKQSELYKDKEFRFIDKLNNAVSSIQAQTIPYDEAKQLYAKLLDEYATIKILTYHSSRYYLNRFFKITSALNRYGSTNPNPISRTRTIKLAVNKTEPVKNNEPITKPEPPITDKPIVKTELSVINERPVIDSDKPKVEPFSPSYKPVVNTEPLKSESSVIPEKPVTKTETSTVPEKQNENTKSLIKPEILYEEQKTISELFKDKVESTPKPANQNVERIPVKIDYVKLNETRLTTGKLGELFALEWEIKRLEREGLKMYCDKVVHVSLTDDSLGYDIKSFEADGSFKYIEVKTTTDAYNAPFYLSETEITAMDNLNNYFIYRIYNFSIEAKRGTIFTINCDNDIEKYYRVQPVSYRISPK
jgi:Domain of unknown function (DUF3883)